MNDSEHSEDTGKREKMEVGKQFYLGTYSVSQKIVYNVLKKRNMTSNTPQKVFKQNIQNTEGQIKW